MVQKGSKRLHHNTANLSICGLNSLIIQIFKDFVFKGIAKNPVFCVQHNDKKKKQNIMTGTIFCYRTLNNALKFGFLSEHSKIVCTQQIIHV